MKTARILVDSREFDSSRKTGIARFLEGLLLQLGGRLAHVQIFLALGDSATLPPTVAGHRGFHHLLLPGNFLQAEWRLSHFSRTGFDLLVSPYPKLPLFGVGCLSIHTVHDVIDLDERNCNRVFRRSFDRWRLKNALHYASLTWYVSSWSQQQTQNLFGTAGRAPRIRPNGIADIFKKPVDPADASIRSIYGLDVGYVLSLSNGKPHKNLGVILNLADKVRRPIVLAGFGQSRRRHWINHPLASAIRWLDPIPDTHLPAVMRGAFCLVLSSNAEGFGYPPLEAMACGVPVIVSDIPVLQETTGGNALYADPRRTESWAIALGQLEDRRRYQSLSKQGLDWARRFKGAGAWASHVSDIECLLAGHLIH